MENNICKEICAKGKHLTDRIGCDDGNIINGDGCDF